MPTILRIAGFRFYFFSDEHLPIHVHVQRGGQRARIELEPAVEVDQNYGFNPAEMKQILRIIDEHYDALIQAWHENFDR